MPRETACPRCRRSLIFGDDSVGQVIACSSCGEEFLAPAGAAALQPPAAKTSAPPLPARTPPAETVREIDRAILRELRDLNKQLGYLVLIAVLSMLCALIGGCLMIAER